MYQSQYPRPEIYIILKSSSTKFRTATNKYWESLLYPYGAAIFLPTIRWWLAKTAYRVRWSIRTV